MVAPAGDAPSPDAAHDHVSDEPPCWACATPWGPHWIELADRAAGQPVRTTLCPRCGLARVGARAHGAANIDTNAAAVAAGYVARVLDPHPWFVPREGDDGRPLTATAADAAAIVERRVDDLAYALRISGVRSARVLHVGAGDGSFLARAHELLGTSGVGLEPWSDGRAQARARALIVHPDPVELWAAADEPEGAPARFDAVVSHHVLDHLDDPLLHLVAIRSRLAPAGLAVIEVPNLERAVGLLQHDVLHPSQRHGFTPESLTALCARAGLRPLRVLADEELRAVCMAARPGSQLVLRELPNVRARAAAMIANDVRVTLKGALADYGATDALLRAASRAHLDCPTPAGRADIALEIAEACRRAGRSALALRWWRHSLRDRPDAEVAQLVARAELARPRTAPPPSWLLASGVAPGPGLAS